MNQDVELSGKEKTEAIAILKRTSFDNLKVDKHYFKNGNPRHGITLEKAKKVYLQFKKILSVFVRSSIIGNKYSFIYRINKKESYYLIFFLERKPIAIFNAYHSGKNIEKRLLRKFGMA